MSHVRIFLEGEGEGFEGIWDNFLTLSNPIFLIPSIWGKLEGEERGGVPLILNCQFCPDDVNLYLFL